MLGPEAAGGPGNPAWAPTKPTGAALAPEPPGAPARRFIKAALAFAVNLSPPCSPINTLAHGGLQVA